MRERLVYLDSSCIVKRYIRERGTDHVDRAYSRSEAGETHLAFPLWNMGEAIGAFDKYLTRGLITEEESRAARSSLLTETIKLSRLGALDVLPVSSDVLVQSWTYVGKHHIYEADALQIAFGKEVACDLFLGADKKLLGVAASEGLDAVNVESTHSLPL